ncbi:Integrase core domain-containing protein [Niastella yeongjuensis]|nr:Integrase core domain-containing protein [Niastella yeongjuensis]
MALANRLYPKPALIHHFDRGSQYCSADYVRILKENDIAISMTENGDPYENALAERVNGILKTAFNLYSNFRITISSCIASSGLSIACV